MTTEDFCPGQVQISHEQRKDPRPPKSGAPMTRLCLWWLCALFPGLTPIPGGPAPHTSLNSAISQENSSGPLISFLIDIHPPPRKMPFHKCAHPPHTSSPPRSPPSSWGSWPLRRSWCLLSPASPLLLSSRQWVAAQGQRGGTTLPHSNPDFRDEPR